MKTSYECIPCFVRQAAEAAALAIEDSAVREKVLRGLIRDISEADWTGTPPVMGQRIHRKIREAVGNPDPYLSIKKEMNRMAKGVIPKLREVLARSERPHEDAVRFAIAGNLLDAGAKTHVGVEDIPEHLMTVLEHPLHGDAEDLFRAAAEAERILYLADNAGEIFFDRLLIEILPTEKITLAVRGRPTINDATREDAEAAGLTDLVPMIDNGSDVPGTVLEDTSPDFQRIFERADMVIAKGQGNYETLSDMEKKIYFLLTVKCPVIARDIGAPTGSLIVKSPRRNNGN